MASTKKTTANIYNNNDDLASNSNNASQIPLLAYAGIAMAVALPQIGAACGTATSAAALANLANDSDKVLKGMVPIVMSGVIGLYGLIGGLVFHGKAKHDNNVAANGAKYLAAGLTLGLSCAASGCAIGQAAHAGIPAYAADDGYYIPMVMSCIFAEALGLYGLITSLVIVGK